MMKPKYDTLGRIGDELIRRAKMGRTLRVSERNQRILDAAASTTLDLWFRQHRQRRKARNS